MTKNKFDPEPAPFEPQKHDVTLSERAETFFSFCRRAFGTSETAPLVIGSEPLNGASLKAIYEAFECCYPVPKQFAPVREPPSMPTVTLKRDPFLPTTDESQ